MQAREYIKNRSIILGGVLIANLIATSFFYLALQEKLTRQNIFYGLFLLLFLETVTFILDYYHEKKKYRTFQALITNIDLLKEENHLSDLDQKYVILLQEVYTQYDQLKEQLSRRRVDYEEFITAWIHDVKIPISVLRLVLDVDKKIQPEVKKTLEEEIYLLEEYMKKIMYFIKIDDFHQDYIPVHGNLKKIVNTSLKSFSKAFSYKKIRLELKNLDHEILTDEKWFSFILSQLISNALKYTSEQGKVTIQGFATETGVSIQITNTGTGIKPRDLNRIFAKGYTGYTGHQEKKATGYGLYLSKILADKLGIKITATSEYGKSATFTVEIPYPNDYHSLMTY